MVARKKATIAKCKEACTARIPAKDGVPEHACKSCAMHGMKLCAAHLRQAKYGLTARPFCTHVITPKPLTARQSAARKARGNKAAKPVHCKNRVVPGHSLCAAHKPKSGGI